MVYVNGYIYKNPHTNLNQGDCIQLTLCRTFYSYLYFCKKFFKKKASIFRFNSWKFFKKKFLQKKTFLKTKKRKNPKYLNFFFLFRLNIPKFFEVDYLTLTIFFIKKYSLSESYYLNKTFSYKLFSLYNFKKLN